MTVTNHNDEVTYEGEMSLQSRPNIKSIQYNN